MAAYGLANLYNKIQDGSFSNLRDNWNKGNYLNVAGTVGSTALDVASVIPAFNVTNRAIDFGLAKAGNNAARGRVIAREINNGIKDGPKLYSRSINNHKLYRS